MEMEYEIKIQRNKNESKKTDYISRNNADNDKMGHEFVINKKYFNALNVNDI